jgi:hypothetical protein
MAVGDQKMNDFPKKDTDNQAEGENTSVEGKMDDTSKNLLSTAIRYLPNSDAINTILGTVAADITMAQTLASVYFYQLAIQSSTPDGSALPAVVIVTGVENEKLEELIVTKESALILRRKNEDGVVTFTFKDQVLTDFLKKCCIIDIHNVYARIAEIRNSVLKLDALTDILLIQVEQLSKNACKKED